MLAPFVSSRIFRDDVGKTTFDPLFYSTHHMAWSYTVDWCMDYVCAYTSRAVVRFFARKAINLEIYFVSVLVFCMYVYISLLPALPVVVNANVVIAALSGRIKHPEDMPPGH